MNKRLQLYLRTPILVFLMNISLISNALANEPINIIASILPQKYFIYKIAGNRVNIVIMVLPGANPATYEPKPDQMTAIAKSRLYFAIGVPFEKTWLKRFSDANPTMTIIHTEEGINKIAMKGKHGYDKEAYNHAEVKDPHIWLSPHLVKIQAGNILKAMVDVDPLYTEQYRANYKVFIREIEGLDSDIKDIFYNRRGSTRFIVFHPSWGYFAEAYGLEQVPIEMEGKEPTARELAGLIKDAKEHNARAIFVQPQFSIKNAETVAKAIGAQLVFADPLAPDWANNLLQVAKMFREALQ